MRRCFALLLMTAVACPAMGSGMDTSDLVPMKWFEEVLPESLPPLTYPGYADALDKAQMQLSTGRYRLALQTLHLAKDSDPVRRALLQAQVHHATGRYAEGLRCLETAALATPETLRLRAQCMAELGQRAEAIDLVRKLATQDKSPQTHALLGQLLISTGQFNAAADALNGFVEQGFAKDWESVESADDLVAIASSLDRLATLKGLYRTEPGLHQTILSMFVRAYDVLDRGHAEAHLRAGEFFLAHDDEGNAQQEAEAATKINPNLIAAWKLAGQRSTHSRDGSGADRAIHTIRKVNPHHPTAALLEAELLIVQREPDEALKILDPLVQRDPLNAELLAAQAAADAIRPDLSVLASRLKAIDAMMPESSLVYFEAGRTMMTLSRPKDAIPYLQEAIRRTPHWNAPRNLLANVYMLGTDIEQARPALTEAHDLDPFNAETTNYLRLLDVLRDYQIVTSEHFAIRYNSKTDPFLAQEMIHYLEANYARICANFAHEPGERTFIELMSENEDFSVRASGRPWHATYAVSLGPVLTIIAPRKSGKTIGPFDWADVIRHEFVHTVTIDQTGGRIPRWFTEGLAVSEQVLPLWNSRIQLLADAANKDKFLPLHGLDAAIIRGKAPELGYSQGHWICKFVQEKYGYNAILAMLQGYRDGLTTDAVFAKCLGLTASEFDREFALWGKAQIAAMGMDRDTRKKVEGLKSQAEIHLKNKEYARARDLLEQAHELSPVDPMVHQRLAGLYLNKTINRPEKALPHLQALDREQLKDNRFAIRLARLYLDLNRRADALASARRATMLIPYDPAAREFYADLLAKEGQSEAAERQRQIAKQIAQPKTAPAQAESAPEVDQ